MDILNQITMKEQHIETSGMQLKNHLRINLQIEKEGFKISYTYNSRS